MMTVAVRPLPEHALLERYRRNGHYADCYATEIPGSFSHAEYVAAFYTTWLFRLERWILRWLVRRPSSDSEVRQLASGETESFAAWKVEARAPNQLLLCDFLGNTRSWLMIESFDDGGVTRLYFGSAIVAHVDPDTGARKLRAPFRALLGFHRGYSRALLAAARSRLQVTA